MIDIGGRINFASQVNGELSIISERITTLNLKL